METTDERRKRLQRERSARWREAHPGAGAAASKKHRETHGNTPWPAKRENGQRVEQYKATTPCIDCTTIYPPECMDFDHVRGEKVNNVGTMVTHGWSWEKIATEIEKCELVCANCHRIRTRKRRASGQATDSTES